jgi:tRNA A-37 threonylcarbamoyl transferase component Bud32
MNPPSDPDRVRELFGLALEHGRPQERDAFLTAACGDDEPLRRRVAALLCAHESPAAFLPGRPAAAGLPAGEGLGTVIGRYKLLERIGEGGFGVVFMADQLEPVRRRVALKIIKPGMDSKQVIGRFEAERQALALMDHPGIARIFDAGTTAAGRPYFVMELVNGIPINRFCEEQPLDLGARLELFIEVCSAVQHAHQKGVIHRDLKPSNLLVTLHGDRPVPKVIDFGIAKALGEPLTDRTVFTQFQQLLGTPAYMSPEQVALSGLDVDTRSDIYSLGVLLYELLTGGPPFDAKELLKSGLDEMRKTICEREPERPSTRLTRRQRGPAARAAGGQISRGDSRIPRELDLIVLKALEKDRDRRYATANGLAADLRRFLHHEPVTAVAPTLGYQIAKFYRRNRKGVVTMLAGAVLLLVAAVAGTALAVRAQRAEALAVREAAAARQAAEFVWQELFKPLTPWQHTNRTITLREAFDRAAAGLGGRFAREPLAEASFRRTFGKTYLGLSEWAAAETNLLRALELRRAYAPQPDEATAALLHDLADLRAFQNRAAEAEAGYAEAAALRLRVLGARHPDTLTAAAKAAHYRAARLPHAEGVALFEATAEDLRRHVGADSHIYRATLNRLGEFQARHARADQAAALFDQAHRLAVAADGPASSDALWSLQLLAEVRAGQGDLDAAGRSLRQLLALREQVNGADHFFTHSVRLQRVAQVLVPQGLHLEAAAELRAVAAAVRAGQPALEPAFAQARQSLLAAWAAAGGGAEYEAFRQEMPAEGERP